MRIDSSNAVAGVPLITIRNSLRGKTRTSWTIGYLAAQLKIRRAHASKLLQKLIARGHVAQDKERRAIARHWFVGENPERIRFYIVTEKGAALAVARVSRPLLRSTAQARLDDLIARASQVNNKHRFLYRAAKIVVFGSFLDESKERINDVDVALFLEPKEADKERFAELCLQKSHGRRIGTSLDALCYPRREVEVFLKSRSTALSIHNGKEHNDLINAVSHRVFFEDSKPARKRARRDSPWF